MNRKKIVAILMGVIISGNICNFNNLEVDAMEPVKTKIESEIEKSGAEQYEMNIILDELDIKRWNRKPYAPDEYGNPVDEPLGKYSEEELKKYIKNDLKVEIDYCMGRLSGVEKEKFLQVVRIYEDGKMTSISCHAWKEDIPYMHERARKVL